MQRFVDFFYWLFFSDEVCKGLWTFFIDCSFRVLIG